MGQVPRVELTYKSQFGEVTSQSPDTVVVGPRALTVKGRFDLPGTGHSLAAAVQQLGSTIILDLTGYPPRDGFGHMVDPVAFEARVIDVDAGTYRLYVRYSIVGPSLRTRIARDLYVTIPE